MGIPPCGQGGQVLSLQSSVLSPQSSVLSLQWRQGRGIECLMWHPLGAETEASNFNPASNQGGRQS